MAKKDLSARIEDYYAFLVGEIEKCEEACNNPEKSRIYWINYSQRHETYKKALEEFYHIFPEMKPRSKISRKR